jgi:hypothetical protein
MKRQIAGKLKLCRPKREKQGGLRLVHNMRPIFQHDSFVDCTPNYPPGWTTGRANFPKGDLRQRRDHPSIRPHSRLPEVSSSILGAAQLAAELLAPLATLQALSGTEATGRRNGDHMPPTRSTGEDPDLST